MRDPLDQRPVKRVLYWQAGLTLVAMIVGLCVAGTHGMVSTALGGGINLLANAGYAWAMRWGARPRTPGATLVTLFRAEAVKLTVVLGLLLLTLVFYKEVRIVIFFATFFVTVLAFGVAFLRNATKPSTSQQDKAVDKEM